MLQSVEKVVFFTFIFTWYLITTVKIDFKKNLQIYYKGKPEISHRNEYSDPVLSALVEEPLTAITASSSFECDATTFAHLDWKIFLPFLFINALKLCQAGWGPSVDNHFQFSPEILDQVQVRALAGPHQNCYCC